MMERRRLLRYLGLGPFGAALPGLANTPAVPSSGGAHRNFHLLAISAAGPQGGPAAPQNQLLMSGHGTFNPAGPGATGGGFYVHFLFSGRAPFPGELALPVVASGTWRPRRVLGYWETATWGLEAAGSLEMAVDLFQQIPSKTVIAEMRLEILSNPPFAGLQIHDRRIGYTLSMGRDFSKGGKFGPFAPLDPPVGIAAFSVAPLP
jgi:hypothetical protein